MVDIVAFQDALIWNLTPDRNYGSLDYLIDSNFYVTEWRKGESYFKFDLGTIDPTKITSLVFRIYCTYLTYYDGPHDLRLAIFALPPWTWDESTITWNNPGREAVWAKTVIIPANRVNTWYEFDLSAVLDKIIFDRTVCFLLTTYDNDINTKFHSREAAVSSAYKPHIRVEVAVAGRCMIVSHSLPSSAFVDTPSPAMVKGRVQTAPVINPAAGLWYKDGPADSVDMSGLTVPRGMISAFYKPGEQPVGTEVLGEADITYPIAGTYYMSAITGYLESPLHPAHLVDCIVEVREKGEDTLLMSKTYEKEVKNARTRV